MATALEQFLSVNMKPMDSPLEQGVEGIGLGMKLAEQQYNNQLKQQEIQLRKQEAQSNFLSKGISSLSALSKVKNPTQRKLLTGVTLNYLQQGGLEDPNGTIQSLLADQDTVQTIVQSLEQSGEKDRDILSIAKLMELANEDPEVAFTKIAELKGKLAEAKSRGLQQYVLEGARQQGRMESAAEKEFGENISKYSISQPVAEMLQKYNGNPAIQNGLLRGYISTVGEPAAFVRNNLKEIQNPTPKQQEAIQRILGALTEAENEYGNPEQRGSAISKVARARAEFGSILASSAQVAPRAAKTTAQKGPALMKDLGSIREQAQKNIKDERTVAQSLDRILKFADRPGPLAAELLVGSMDAIRSGKLNVLREGDMDRALAAQGIYDKVEVFLKKYTGKKDPKLGPEIRKEYKEIAEAYKSVVTQQIADSYAPYIEQARGIGASEDQIKKIVVNKSLHKYLFPELQKKSAEQATPFFPTPTGEQIAAPVAAPVSAPLSGAKRGKPSQEKIDRFKKEFPNDWKRRLDGLGFDVGGL